jgi:hypothetical protein
MAGSRVPSGIVQPVAGIETIYYLSTKWNSKALPLTTQMTLIKPIG